MTNREYRERAEAERRDHEQLNPAPPLNYRDCALIGTPRTVATALMLMLVMLVAMGMAIAWGILVARAIARAVGF